MLSLIDPPLTLEPSIAHASVRFTHEAGTDSFSMEAGLRLPRNVLQAVPRRKAEYLAGRFCARHAIQRFLPAFTGEVSTRADRAPSWPQGLVGSITHTAGLASAAVGRTSDIAGIGIDAEQVLTNEALGTVRSYVSTPTERQRLSGTLPEPSCITLLFSAKESLYKCLHPIAQRFFSFEDACVEDLCVTDTDPSAGTFRIRLLVALHETLRAGMMLSGSFRITEDCVHTGIVLPASSPRTSW